ncbi:MAG TPA: nuclear transport factor 2 family protein [Burkholderiaceae bacterium]
MIASPHTERLRAVIAFYETIAIDTVPQLAELYAADAWFKDPFNDVAGVAAIDCIFRHMYAQVDAPRFVVHTHVLQDDDAFLTWEFHCTPKGRHGPPLVLRGATHLRFNAQGKVAMHRDYWDTSEELYEKLPVIGWLMRALHRRGAAPHDA